MTPDQINRVASMAHALRPDWPVASLVTFIERNLALRAYGDLVVAMAWVASRTETKTPRLLLEAGVWWKAAVTDEPTRAIRRPPQKSEECRTHVGEWRDFCRGCISDRKAAHDAEHTPDGGNWTPDRIRAELHGAAGNELEEA